MKNIYLILLGVIALTYFACKKETPIEPEPIPPVVPPVYVPIYEPGDTSLGAAYANKLTATWKGSVFCKTTFLDPTRITLQFFTYTSDGSYREQLVLDAIPKSGGLGQYKVIAPDGSYPAPSGKMFSFYTTLALDGDVLEDGYQVDSTDAKNNLLVTKVDWTNKRVEGTFHVSYNIREPRINPANPKKVTFSEGRFWATIRD